MIVDENNFETFQKVANQTLTDYEIRWFSAENMDGYIEPETMLVMIDDLLLEVEHWKEKFEDSERDKEDNYRPIPYSEQI